MCRSPNIHDPDLIPLYNFISLFHIKSCLIRGNQRWSSSTFSFAVSSNVALDILLVLNSKILNCLLSSSDNQAWRTFLNFNGNVFKIFVITATVLQDSSSSMNKHFICFCSDPSVRPKRVFAHLSIHLKLSLLENLYIKLINEPHVDFVQYPHRNIKFFRHLFIKFIDPRKYLDS